MSNTQQSLAYHVRAFAGSKWRQVGTVFVAGSDAPIYVRGHLIYYRLLNNDVDLWMYRDMTTGFSKAVFERVTADGVDYVVAHSKETGRMLLTPVGVFNKVANYSQGVQIRAKVDDSVILEGVKRLIFPTAIGTVQVNDEAPAATSFSQPVPAQPVAQKPAPKVTMQRCGCSYADGVIDRPCGSHAAMWEPVLRARASIG